MACYRDSFTFYRLCLLVEVQPTVLDGGQRLTSRPRCFTPGSVTWIQKLGGPQRLYGRSKGKANPVRGRGDP
jgi:hypothetical protein